MTLDPRIDEPGGLSRRRFLQAALAAGSAAAIFPDLLFNGLPLAASASGDRALVLVELIGGNDGLNTVVPYGSGIYQDLRRPAGLALDGTQVHHLPGGLGLHQSLSYLKSRFDAGDVAIVQGFGHPDNNRSHFGAMEMLVDSGPTLRPAISGWAGRYLDSVAAGPFGGVAVGGGSPSMLLSGGEHVPLTLPSSGGLSSSDRSWPPDRLAIETLDRISVDSTGAGRWGPAAAESLRSVLQYAQQLEPVYRDSSPVDDGFARDLFTAARILNLGVGTRVLHVRLGGFDAHTQQVSGQALSLSRLDTGLRVFFETLAPELHDRVVIATFSEFGRRPTPNGSNGTDHGGASVQFVVGRPVLGGFVGDPPQLDRLDARGDVPTTVDARSLFATLVGSWLGGDDRAVFAGAYEHLGLFATQAAPGGSSAVGSDGSMVLWPHTAAEAPIATAPSPTAASATAPGAMAPAEPDDAPPSKRRDHQLDEQMAFSVAGGTAGSMANLSTDAESAFAAAWKPTTANNIASPGRSGGRDGGPDLAVVAASTVLTAAAIAAGTRRLTPTAPDALEASAEG